MEFPIDPQDQDSPLTSFLVSLAAQIKGTQLPDGGVQGYVLRYGRLFRSQALTRDEQQFIDSLGWRRHPPQPVLPERSDHGPTGRHNVPAPRPIRRGLRQPGHQLPPSPTPGSP